MSVQLGPDNDKTVHPLQQCLRDNGEQIAAAVTEAQFREVLAINEKLKQDCMTYLHEVEQLKAQPAADCGLEVVAWRIGFPNGAGYKVYEQHQPWAYEQYGTTPFVTYEVQELISKSDADARDAMRLEMLDTYGEMIKELEATVEKLSGSEVVTLAAKRLVRIAELEADVAKWKGLAEASQTIAEISQNSAARMDALKAQPAPVQDEVPCSTHPDAPHGFNRDSSHSLDRYVCDCEGWEPPVQEPICYITGYHGGNCVVKPVNNSAVLPTNMALYAAPQPSDDAKDAARYRWLRKHNGDMTYRDVRCFVEIPQGPCAPELKEISGKKLDAAIDAAMAGGWE